MLIVLLLMIAAIALASLVSGASYLETMLPGGLPLGNALTAAGLCAAAAAAVGLSGRESTLRLLSIASLIGAGAWLPVSVVLAGNPTLNFSGIRGEAWLAFSLAIAVAVIGVLSWALLAALLARLRRAGAALEP